MGFEIIFVLLFSVATAVAILARRVKVPYTAALVVAGLVLGIVGTFDGPALTKELLYAIFLPGLLFEAAFHVEFKSFLRNKWTVMALAIPGLLVAIALTAVILVPIVNALGLSTDFTLIYGLVFASLIAATDPIAVVALFKSLGAPKRLAILVEGESLVNDGTAVVVFTLMLQLATGSNFTVGSAIGQFVYVAGAGAIVGLLFGFCVSWLTHHIDDPMVEITLTTIAAYGAFAVGEHFHVSGVIATVVAGMMCGNYGARTGMSPTTKVAVFSFWDYWAFALNSIVFLLIGMEVDLQMLLDSWQAIFAAFGAVLVARVFVVYTTSGLLRLTREKFPWTWSAILTWGGLRGSLSMVLVLALPADFPHRALLVNMTFGVVLLSILGQGLSIGYLLRKLGVTTGDRHTDLELHRGQLRSANAALREIEKMRSEREVSPQLLAELQTGYAARATEAESEIADMHMAKTELREQSRLTAARHLLLVEKEALLEGRTDGLIGQEAYDQLVSEADARLIGLEDNEPPPTEPQTEPEPETA